MTKQADCPQCSEPASLAVDNPWRPFCSRRCKLIDLGEWFAERHTIPGEALDDSALDANGQDDPRH